jgi:two-component system chemotaxis response regulator CheY
MKILVVDDSSTMRRIIINVILQLGYKKDEITEAENGQQAWEYIQQDTFNIVLTDWNMPVMSGLDLVKNIRSKDSLNDLPIIMITTEGGKAEVVTALRAGVNNYIVKPFTAALLKEKLNAVFSA